MEELSRPYLHPNLPSPFKIGLKVGTDASAMAAQPAPDVEIHVSFGNPLVFPWIHETKGIFTYTWMVDIYGTLVGK